MRSLVTVMKSSVKFIPERKQKSVPVYSMNGELKNSVDVLCVENPPVAVVVMA